MFKLLNLSYTNKQFFTNKTPHRIDIKILSSQSDQIFSGVVNGNETTTIDVKRNNVGTAKANVILSFQNGITIEYSFGIEASNCTDRIDIYEDHVVYNKKTRGKKTSDAVKNLIDLD